MSDNKPAAEVDVTKDWQATQGQKSPPSAFAFSPRCRGSSPSAARSPGSSCSTAQVRPWKPAAADRHPGRDRDLRDCRQPDVEGGQQARSGPRVREVQVLRPEPARRDHHADRLPAAGCPDLHGQGHGPEEQEDRRRRRCRAGRGRDTDRGRAGTRRRSSNTPRT